MKGICLSHWTGHDGIQVGSHDQSNSTEAGFGYYQTSSVLEQENWPHGWKMEQPRGSLIWRFCLLSGLSLLQR